MSKTTLFKRFDASMNEIILSIPIKVLANPFSLLETVWQQEKQSQFEEKSQDSIILPLYNDDIYQVNKYSEFNAALRKPKVKGSNRPRLVYEAYLPIPIYIHYLYPNFFWIDVLDRKARGQAFFIFKYFSSRSIT